MDLKLQLLQILEATKEEIIANMKSEGITTTGRTAESLRVEERGNHIMLIQGDGNGAPITTTQFGREGGKVPMGFNAIILQWMKDKGISADPIPYIRKPSEKWQPMYTPTERGLMARAGAIAHKIKMEGTKRHREPNLSVYSEAVNKAVDKIAKEITNLVISEIRK